MEACRLTFSACRKVTPGGLEALFVDRYGPTVNMFSPLVLSECEAIGAVAGDENTARTFDNSSEKT